MRRVLILVPVLVVGLLPACSEVAENVDDEQPVNPPSDELLYADFTDGAAPFQDADRPSFTATAVDGMYRIQVRGVGRSFAPLSSESDEVIVVVEVAEMTGPGVGTAAIGVGCTGEQGEGYTLLVDTEGGMALIWDTPDAEGQALEFDDDFAIPGSGSIEQLAIVCAGDADTGTTIAVAVNGVEVAGHVHQDGLVVFSTVGLVFNAGSEPWEVAIDLVDAHLPRADDPVSL